MEYPNLEVNDFDSRSKKKRLKVYDKAIAEGNALSAHTLHEIHSELQEICSNGTILEYFDTRILTEGSRSFILDLLTKINRSISFVCIEIDYDAMKVRQSTSKFAIESIENTSKMSKDIALYQKKIDELENSKAQLMSQLKEILSNSRYDTSKLIENEDKRVSYSLTLDEILGNLENKIVSIFKDFNVNVTGLGDVREQNLSELPKGLIESILDATGINPEDFGLLQAQKEIIQSYLQECIWNYEIVIQHKSFLGNKDLLDKINFFIKLEADKKNRALRSCN